MTTGPLLIRPSLAADMPAITAIYGQAVTQSSASFELEAPDLAEMTRRRADVLAIGMPYLVGEVSGDVLDYAYALPFRPRLGYRFCLEDSIYLHPAARGQGLGRLLLAELVASAQAAGARQMLAVIGDANNIASIKVHQALGFREVGVLQSAGRKFDRWIDVILMQRTLGAGDSTGPVE